MKSQHTVKVIGSKSHEAMWADIAKEACEQTPPEGALTCADFAREYNVTSRQAQFILGKRVSLGQLDCGKFRTMTATGFRSLLYYWRAKK